MEPGQHPITLRQGANDGLTFDVKDAGIAIDLTGYSAEMQIRRDYDKPPVLIASTANGKIVITGLLGIVSISFLPADTSSIRFAGGELECIYDIELTSPAGIVSRILEGACTISREVTRG